MLLPLVGALVTLLGCHDLTAPERLATPDTAFRTLNPAGNVVVWPGDQHGWWFMNDDTGGPCGDAARCRFVTGPGTPPLGTGSAELAATSALDATLVLDDYASTRLDHISALAYSTYRQTADAANRAAVTLQLNVDYDLTDASIADQGRLVYEPWRNATGGVPQSAWQRWDARAGLWWGTNARGRVGGVLVTNSCVKATPCTWAQLVARFPNIGIHPEEGGIILKALNGAAFRGNVDNLVLTVDGATTTFDFEAQAATSFPETFPTEISPSLWDSLTAPGNVLNRPPSMSGRVIRDLIHVSFVDSASNGARAAVIASINGKVVGGEVDFLYQVRIPYALGPGDSTSGPLLRAIAALKANPLVDVVGPVRLKLPEVQFKRPNFGSGFNVWPLWPDSAAVSMPNWNLVSMAAPFAWGCATGGVSVGPSPAIAVVDGGFYGIGDLLPNLRGTTEYSDATRPTDSTEHGTLVSSVIAARGRANGGFSGVMWEASLSLYNMFPKAGKPDDIGPQLSAIQRAMAAHARVINLSVGLDLDTLPPIQDDYDNALFVSAAFRKLVKRAMKIPGAVQPLFVVSAGNDGIDAKYSGYATAAQDVQFRRSMIVVGASQIQSTGRFTLAHFKAGRGSNSGSLVDVVAPGYEVTAVSRSGPVSVEGTSIAAPHVTGVAGLLLSFDDRLSADSLRSLIISGANRNPQRAVTNSVAPGSPLPTLDAYESLKLAATRSGAPLCGNRVWTVNSNLFVERAPNTAPEQIMGSSVPIWEIDVRHGGHQIDFRAQQADGYVEGHLSFASGRWGTTTTAGTELDGGTFSSMLGWSHEQDAMIYTTVEQGTQGGAIPPDSEQVTVTVSDSLGDRTATRRYKLGGSGPSFASGETMSLKQTWVVARAFPQQSDSLLFAVNRMRGSARDQSFTCEDDRGLPLICHDAAYAFVPDTTYLYVMSAHATNPVPRLIRAIPDTAIYWIGFSETDSSTVLALGSAVDSIWTNDGMRFQQWCSIQYRNSRAGGTSARSVSSLDGCKDHFDGQNAASSVGAGTMSRTAGGAGALRSTRPVATFYDLLRRRRPIVSGSRSASAPIARKLR